jgi:hypothetical protein
MTTTTPGGHLDTTDDLLRANAAMRTAVMARKRGTYAEHCSDDSYDASDDHPVLSDPDDESEDVADPLHERGMSAKDIIGRFAPHPSSRRFVELLDEMQQLHASKSRDYGSEDDPLANVRQGAEFVDIEPWRGCMVRIADKVQRLRTYCRTGTLVHEGVRDTLMDLAAYSLLAIVLFEESDE